MITQHLLPPPNAHDDAATSEYYRGPPLPVRPTLLAPHPRFPQLPPPRSAPAQCPTCPFRQVPDRTLALSHGPAGPQLTHQPATLSHGPGGPPFPNHPTTLSHGPGGPQFTNQHATLSQGPGGPPFPNQPATLSRGPGVPQFTNQHATVTQLLPASSTGSTTVLQAVAPAPPRRRPPPPPSPRRAYLPRLQLALWLVIAAGLLILAVRPLFQ